MGNGRKRKGAGRKRGKGREGGTAILHQKLIRRGVVGNSMDNDLIRSPWELRVAMEAPKVEGGYILTIRVVACFPIPPSVPERGSSEAHEIMSGWVSSLCVCVCYQ